MSRLHAFFRVSASLLFVVLPIQLAAQQPTAPPTSRVPSQIATAHTVFLANAGTGANFPIDATQSYNAVYSALQSWGFYQLVDAPNKADLILSLRGLSPITGVAGDADNVYSVTTPSFQIAFIDPHTNVTLWTLTSPVIVAGNRTQQAHWQQISLTNLISRIKVLANQPLSAAETTALTTYPATHFKRNLLIVVGGTAALGAGSFLLIHGLYEHGLASGKAQQDAFCNANNIPLSECAGG